MKIMEILKETLMKELNKEDKTLWEDEWIAVKQKDGWYTYTHSVKSNGEGVAVLGYSYDDGERMVLGRYENTPPHNDGIALTSLTGMVEDGLSPLETAVKELKEESGIAKDKSDFEEVGTIRPSKSSDTVMHLFAIDLSSEFEVDKKFLGKGDGTKGEEGAYCKFVTVDEAIDCKDALLSIILLRSLKAKL